MVVERSSPVPDVRAPMKSEKMERNPIRKPPRAAAGRMYLASLLTISVSLYPLHIIFCS